MVFFVNEKAFWVECILNYFVWERLLVFKFLKPINALNLKIKLTNHLLMDVLCRIPPLFLTIIVRFGAPMPSLLLLSSWLLYLFDPFLFSGLASLYIQLFFQNIYFLLTFLIYHKALLNFYRFLSFFYCIYHLLLQKSVFFQNYLSNFIWFKWEFDQLLINYI